MNNSVTKLCSYCLWLYKINNIKPVVDFVQIVASSSVRVTGFLGHMTNTHAFFTWSTSRSHCKLITSIKNKQHIQAFYKVY